ncbi:hypothetical protein D3C81_1822510 [compost metagenome]
MPHRGIRNFELADDHVCGLQHRIKPVDHCGRHGAIGAGDDDNGVLTVVIDHDQRHTTGVIDSAHCLAIDLFGQQGVA